MPELYSCFSQGPDSDACKAAEANFTNPFWRASQAGAMQTPNLEEGPTGEACFNVDQPCNQGNIVSMAVAVHNPIDVALTLQFAQQFDIRVVVKSTGHEYQGRSTAAGALLIWMHEYTGVSVNEEFRLPCDGSIVPAVTVLGGTDWGYVYDNVPAQWGVVGGNCRSVCACGGFTLSGGHSFMSPQFGLAVDNVLQFQAVLVNGTITNVSSCSHPDLFWALRGGGGGTFAVITSVTYMLHPTPAEGVTGLTLEVDIKGGESSLVAIIEQFLTVYPQLISPARTGGVYSGYLTILSFLSFQLVSVYNGTQSGAEASMQPFISFLENSPSLFEITNKTFFYAGSMNEWHNSVVSYRNETGQPGTMGGRLVPLSYCLDPTNRTKAAAALAKAGISSGELKWMMVAGGSVSTSDIDSTQTSVTPAWRTAAFQLTLGKGWHVDTPFILQQAYFSLVSTWTDILRETFPDSGSYFSESDFHEPSWQDNFWGASNYARLQSIKAQYDPNNVFTCHHCVQLPGSTDDDL